MPAAYPFTTPGEPLFPLILQQFSCRQKAGPANHGTAVRSGPAPAQLLCRPRRPSAPLRAGIFLEAADNNVSASDDPTTGGASWYNAG